MGVAALPEIAQIKLCFSVMKIVDRNACIGRMFTELHEYHFEYITKPFP